MAISILIFVILSIIAKYNNSTSFSWSLLNNNWTLLFYLKCKYKYEYCDKIYFIFYQLKHSWCLKKYLFLGHHVTVQNILYATKSMYYYIILLATVSNWYHVIMIITTTTHCLVFIHCILKICWIIINACIICWIFYY